MTTLNAAKKIVAWLPMYACYYGADLACRLLHLWPDCKDGSLGDRLGTVVYRIYNKGMCASADLNDWAGFKLWSKCSTDDSA